MSLICKERDEDKKSEKMEYKILNIQRLDPKFYECQHDNDI